METPAPALPEAARPARRLSLLSMLFLPTSIMEMGDLANGCARYEYCEGGLYGCEYWVSRSAEIGELDIDELQQQEANFW